MSSTWLTPRTGRRSSAVACSARVDYWMRLARRMAGTGACRWFFLTARSCATKPRCHPPPWRAAWSAGSRPASGTPCSTPGYFFWCDHARLERQSRACAPRPQLVLTLDTTRLLARHGARTALTPFNTGFARRQAAPRGRDTFVPYTVWLETGWTSEAAVHGNGKIRPFHHAPVGVGDRRCRT